LGTPTILNATAHHEKPDGHSCSVVCTLCVVIPIHL